MGVLIQTIRICAAQPQSYVCCWSGQLLVRSMQLPWKHETWSNVSAIASGLDCLSHRSNFYQAHHLTSPADPTLGSNSWQQISTPYALSNHLQQGLLLLNRVPRLLPGLVWKLDSMVRETHLRSFRNLASSLEPQVDEQSSRSSHCRFWFG